MALFTPKNHPWIAASGYETVDAYPVPSLPVTSQRVEPCYVPKGMCTAPLKFPSLVFGCERNPLHPARAALSLRYSDSKWFDNLDILRAEVASNLEDSLSVKQNLENLAKEKRERLGEIGTSKTTNRDLVHFEAEVDRLCTRLEMLIANSSKMQDCRRELQSSIQNIEAPKQISQECLRHRELRHRMDLVNDEAERLLMREIEFFHQCQENLEKYLVQCENHLLQARKLQSELENFIKKIQWIIVVEKSEDKVERFLDSTSFSQQSACLVRNCTSTIANSKHLREQIIANIKEAGEKISKVWHDTSDALVKRKQEIQKARDEIQTYLIQIKNEIFNVEENLKYLKSNKGIDDVLQKGENQVASLLRTKENLESELSSKINSLFIDVNKCTTIRKCYPISIITKQ